MIANEAGDRVLLAEYGPERDQAAQQRGPIRGTRVDACGQGRIHQKIGCHAAATIKPGTFRTTPGTRQARVPGSPIDSPRVADTSPRSTRRRERRRITRAEPAAPETGFGE